jgi:hypothetical protein
MAKTKTKKVKKEELVDLTPKPEKITDEQLKNVQSIINNINQHQMEIGNIETRKHHMLHNLVSIQDRMTLMQNDFQKEYGTIDINIQDGTINYPPEPITKKENGETDKED